MIATFNYKLARELYESGKTMGDVARIFGVSIGSIHRAIHKTGGQANKYVKDYKWQIVNGYNQRKIKGSFVKEHRLIVERILGYKLPNSAPIHHVNGNRNDNRHENLVVCQDHKYHMLLHVRTEALEKSGNANYRKCQFCKTYDSIANMLRGGGIYTETYYHSLCRSHYRKLK